MEFPDTLVAARFVWRLNRFAALVSVDGAEALAHVANSGRLHELFQPGVSVLLAPTGRDGRKTTYDLTLVRVDGVLVSADARLPSALVHEALLAGVLPPFLGYTSCRREVAFGESRLDLLLEGQTGRCYVEVKSVTLVVEGAALFPDAPTARGRKHLGSLERAVSEGHRAAVVFVVQREDATRFQPHDAADPEFGEALRRAARNGVEVYAYGLRVSELSIPLHGSLPVRL